MGLFKKAKKFLGRVADKAGSAVEKVSDVLADPRFQSVAQVAGMAFGVSPALTQGIFRGNELLRGVAGIQQPGYQTAPGPFGYDAPLPNASGLMGSPNSAMMFRPGALPTSSNVSRPQTTYYQPYNAGYQVVRPPTSPYPPSPRIGSGSVQNPYFRPQQFQPRYPQQYMSMQRGGGSRMSLAYGGGY